MGQQLTRGAAATVPEADLSTNNQVLASMQQGFQARGAAPHPSAFPPNHISSDSAFQGISSSSSSTCTPPAQAPPSAFVNGTTSSCLQYDAATTTAAAPAAAPAPATAAAAADTAGNDSAMGVSGNRDALVRYALDPTSQPIPDTPGGRACFTTSQRMQAAQAAADGTQGSTLSRLGDRRRCRSADDELMDSNMATPEDIIQWQSLHPGAQVAGGGSANSATPATSTPPSAAGSANTSSKHQLGCGVLHLWSLAPSRLHGPVCLQAIGVPHFGIHTGPNQGC